MTGAEKLLNNLSTHLRNTIARGLSLATSLEHAEVTPLHLLYGMIEEKGAIGAEILHKVGLDPELIFTYLSLKKTDKKSKDISESPVPELNEFSKQALEKAMLIAYDKEHVHIGTEHLLLGLITTKDPNIANILKQSKIAPKLIIEQVETILNSTSKFPEMDEVIETLDAFHTLQGEHDEHMLPDDMHDTSETTAFDDTESEKPKKKKKKRTKAKNARAIDLFAIDLTNPEIQADIDPVIGRDIEINRIINILSRRTKNNPILIGEPGVGKTAIIEGLAKKIMSGDVPAHLKRKKILSLDLTMLIAGTIYRGEFEARLKQIIEEVSNNPDLILFIDEVHNIIGTGSNQGTMDAANILKPALARGLLRCIGATTYNEYKKYIAADTALERRFQVVTVEEPSKMQSAEIIKGIRKYYEKFHDITIHDNAIDAAVTLSSKYMQDQQLPDKAIDLIDEASARARVTQSEHPAYNELQQIRADYDSCAEKKREAIMDENFALASELKKEEKKLETQIARLEKKLKTITKETETVVTKQDIAKILGNRLQINADTLLMSDIEKLGTIEKKLKTNIIGQNNAIEKLTKGLRHAFLGLSDDKKPLASLLLVGPSGVGKTELAKLLAQELYHDAQALIRLDMSEFSESHSTAKLLGSPAGYVGYNDKNTILDMVKRRPYAILLFDECDKAHPDVTKLLLQILDEGMLTDASGKKTSFKNTIVILTSNIGSELFKSKGIGFDQNTSSDQIHTPAFEKQIHAAVKESLSPALTSRINQICIFNPLEKNHLEQIIDNHIQDINTRLRETQNVSIKVPKETLTTLAQTHHHDEFGARYTKQAIRELLEELISEKIATRTSNRKKTYTLKEKNKNYLLS